MDQQDNTDQLLNYYLQQDNLSLAAALDHIFYIYQLSESANEFLWVKLTIACGS